MSNASDLADAIGRKKLADALDVGLTAVSNAVVRGWFPATWFIVVSGLARQQGLSCSPELFKMRPLDGSQSVDCQSEAQEDEEKNISGDAA